MQPLEQEVARACSARRAKGIGSGPVIRRAMVIGGSFWLLVAVVIAVAATQGAFQRLFHDNQVLTFALIIGLGGFCVGHLTRGTLSSHHRFGRYGAFFSVDGLIRVVLAAALGVLGVLAAGPWGLVMALTPFVAVFFALWRQKGLLEPGPDAPWGELTQNLGWLLLGTSSISLVVQGGTIAVGRLATSSQQAAAGQFLNGLQTARIPLFLFQAILASLLPKLSRQAETGRLAEFSAGLRRLVLAILALGLVAVVGAAVLGPAMIRIVFGKQSALDPMGPGRPGAGLHHHHGHHLHRPGPGGPLRPQPHGHRLVLRPAGVHRCDPVGHPALPAGGDRAVERGGVRLLLDAHLPAAGPAQAPGHPRHRVGRRPGRSAHRDVNRGS